MGTGAVINGNVVEVSGLDVQNFLDNPHLKLAPDDVRSRNPREQAWIHLIVVHTTGGIPGGKDLRPQVIRPGVGASSNAGERVVGSWTHDAARHGGAHFIVDFDRKVYCCADLVTQAAYHAERANGVSVGIEVVQGHDAELYQGQIEATVQLVLWLCTNMPTPIQAQIPLPYRGKPIARFVESQDLANPLSDVVGVVGHRDLTANRGEGDPGNAIMDALAAAGCERLDFEAEQDIETWKKRQAALGIAKADGIPGPGTVAALKAAGHTNGLWLPVTGNR
jgi:hypothetical protein